jgi:hypothetical protein
MSVIAIVGCYDDESEIPIRGGGKTATAIRLLHDEYFKNNKTIMSNVHIYFSGDPKNPGERIFYYTAQELLNMFLNREIPKNTVILFDELSFYLTNLGVDPLVVITFVNGLVAQSRKLRTDLIHTEQRYGDIPRRLRPHSDSILIPMKIHYDGSVCYKDFSCSQPHIIQVYSEKPWRESPILEFYAEKVGQFYDTEEVIYDTLEISKKKPEKKPESAPKKPAPKNRRD